jgi:hypothetical protein
MISERSIHAGIFFLLLVGLSILTSWASYNYLKSNLILVIGSILLVWGIILLAMYLGFKRLGWNWWS